MTEAHDLLNAAGTEEATAMLLRCCGSTRWALAMAERRPFASRGDLHAAAEEVYWGLSRPDYLEAFACHPRIGESTPAGGAGHATAPWSHDEQSTASKADGETREALRAANAAYEARFGHVFLVCATGRGAAEILALLEARMAHEPEHELGVAAAEQAKITALRLDKLGR